MGDKTTVWTTILSSISMKYLFTGLLFWTCSSATAQVILPAYQGVYSKVAVAGSTFKDGLSSATAGTSATQIKQNYPSSTDGIYWIANPNINGETPFPIYADMTTSGGGWMLLNSSGGSIASSEVSTITSLASCGYLPKATVIQLATISTTVQLRSGPLSNKIQNITTSTNSKPIISLRSTDVSANGPGTWHYNSTYSSFVASSGSSTWYWHFTNGVANGWPNMYHSSGRADGVHWLPSYAGGGGRLWSSGEYYSTWIK